MAIDRRDLVDAFIELMRDECGATVSLKPDSAEFAAVLEALRKAAGEPPSPPPQPAPGAARAASVSREGSR
jgi:hypothetical protein